MKRTKTLVISAFPGCGKTVATEKLKKIGYRVLDSDSSLFDKFQFPENYIEHIKGSCEKSVDIIFVSSHKVVRDSIVRDPELSRLRDCGKVVYLSVWPSPEIKEEYIQRYIDRGSSKGFIELLRNNYESWVAEMSENPESDFWCELMAGDYLLDVVIKFIQSSEREI